MNLKFIPPSNYVSSIFLAFNNINDGMSIIIITPQMPPVKFTTNDILFFKKNAQTKLIPIIPQVKAIDYQVRV